MRSAPKTRSIKINHVTQKKIFFLKTYLYIFLNHSDLFTKPDNHSSGKLPTLFMSLKWYPRNLKRFFCSVRHLYRSTQLVLRLPCRYNSTQSTSVPLTVILFYVPRLDCMLLVATADISSSLEARASVRLLRM